MTTRLFFATDIHGSEACFLKFINATTFYRAQVLIMGGDITGKMMVPLVKEHSGITMARFMDRTWEVHSDEELSGLIKRIRRSGGYPYVCTRENYDYLVEDVDAMNRVFSETMVSETKRMVDIAEEKLSKIRVRCYITPGNDDEMVIDEAFEGREWVSNPEGKVVYIDEHHQMISTGYANLTPWECPRDVPEEILYEKIETMANQLDNPESAIFNLHCPPYASLLDESPQLDENLTPVIVAGEVHMIPVGSTAVREALERWQPLLGIHGHIHESRGRSLIGKTACFNPGSEYASGYLRGLIIDLDCDKIKQYQLTTG